MTMNRLEWITYSPQFAVGTLLSVCRTRFTLNGFTTSKPIFFSQLKVAVHTRWTYTCGRGKGLNQELSCRNEINRVKPSKVDFGTRLCARAHELVPRVLQLRVSQIFRQCGQGFLKSKDSRFLLKREQNVPGPRRMVSIGRRANALSLSRYRQNPGTSDPCQTYTDSRTSSTCVSTRDISLHMERLSVSEAFQCDMS